MDRNIKKAFCTGVALIALFAVWTVLVQTVDVRPAGQSGTTVGFAALNCRFHEWTGVNMPLYTLTDWLGLVPVLVCLGFAGLGAGQLIFRKSLFRVDPDLLILGVHYGIVMFCFIIFELFPVNYRPILINGAAEASYPSSTTLLVLGVMPTLAEQAGRRLKPGAMRASVRGFAAAFSVFMVAARLLSGVHWVTDIVGSALLCAGLFALYRAAVLLCMKK